MNYLNMCKICAFCYRFPEVIAIEGPNFYYYYCLDLVHQGLIIQSCPAIPLQKNETVVGHIPKGKTGRSAKTILLSQGR